MVEPLTEAWKTDNQWDNFEAVFAKALRDISQKNPTVVGSNLLSVYLPNPSRSFPRVKFMPNEEHVVSVRNRDGVMEKAIVYYTPWMISSKLLHPPSAQVGDNKLDLDGTPIFVVGAKPSGSIPAWVCLPHHAHLDQNETTARARFKRCYPVESHFRSSNQFAVDPTVVALDEYSTRVAS